MGFFGKLVEKFTSTNTLYYPGCMTRFMLPDIQKNYETILKKLGIDFIMLKDEELCCGSPVLRAGYKQDFDDLKQKNLELFKRFGVKKIIVNCPGCFEMFKNKYGLEVIHFTELLLQYKYNIKTERKGSISYHDPCHLGRMCNMYSIPRKCLNELGFDVVEFSESKEMAMCCGAGGGVRNNFPDVANKIAKLRLTQAKTKNIVNVCPMCYYHMKENNDTNEIFELSQLAVHSLKEPVVKEKKNDQKTV
jgi:Fe-S oxidoreductase